MKREREALLAIVDASPAAVAAHDKRAWLDLFSQHGVVEDPVGTPPRRKGAFSRRIASGDDDLGRFYETFIAPNQIRFEVERDVVLGHEVARDVIIHTTAKNGLQIAVPTHLLYQLTEEGGDFRVERMAAHWEASRLTLTTLRSGRRGWGVLIASSWRMLAQLGPGGVMAYAKGTVQGIGENGRAVVAAFAEAFTAQRSGEIEDLCARPDTPLELPAGVAVPARELLRSVGKDAALAVSKIRPSGWATSCSFELHRIASPVNGIAFFAFDPDTRRIASARFFWEEAADPGPLPPQ